MGQNLGVQDLAEGLGGDSGIVSAGQGWRSGFRGWGFGVGFGGKGVWFLLEGACESGISPLRGTTNHPLWVFTG